MMLHRLVGLSYFILLFEINLVFSCLNSGCGGGCGCGGCGGYSQPAPASCVPPCPTGYTCGPYGCARNRARASVIRKSDALFGQSIYNESEPLRNMFGITRNKTRLEKEITLLDKNNSPATKNFHSKLGNPNDIFRQCCEDRLLPDSCLSKCSFNAYTRAVLQQMFLNNDACPIAAAADMQFCAAQGRDHSECCLRYNVHTTLGGNKCLIFCDQRPGSVTKLDYGFLPCYERFDEIKQCLYEGMKEEIEKMQTKSTDEFLK